MLLLKRVIAVILGGGRGARLFPLTKMRSKPAVPFAGKYRLVDIPISSCLHAGIDHIYVLTQFNSVSLNRHVSRTYRFGAFTDGFVEILAAEQTLDSTNWYQGTADAVRHHMRRFTEMSIDQCLILSGDHVYQMDYRDFIQRHRQLHADISIAVKPVGKDEARSFGILKIDPTGRIIDFVEKPQTDEELDHLRTVDPPWGNPDKPFLASMGIYVFETHALEESLTRTPKEDFGRHIIPAAIRHYNVQSYFFDGYWEDIGTIKAFYEANLALTDPGAELDLYRTDNPLYTHSRHLPGAKLDGCTSRRSIICEGAEIWDSTVERSIIGIRSVIGPGTQVANTVMMGSDYYESPKELQRNREKGLPNLGIGPRCQIDGAIIDKNARIGEGVVIRNPDRLVDADGEGYFIRDGIVIIPKDAAILPDTRI